jgi:HlyD family secretion protein
MADATSMRREQVSALSHQFTEDEMIEETKSAAVMTPIAAETAPSAGPPSKELVPTPASPLPVIPTIPKQKRARRLWPRVVLALAVVAGLAGGGYYFWRQSQSQLPPGIAFGNGRIEADEIDIDTKFAGRIFEMLAD